MHIHQIRLKRVETQVVGVSLSEANPRLAVTAAFSTYRGGGFVPVEVDGIAVCVCSECYQPIIDGDGALKDANGRVLCFDCLPETIDVEETETQVSTDPRW